MMTIYRRWIYPETKVVSVDSTQAVGFHFPMIGNLVDLCISTLKAMFEISSRKRAVES